MPPVGGAERWFHTLVVVGTSLAGCGGATSEKGMPATGGSGSGSGGVTSMAGSTTAGTSSAGTSGGSTVGPSMCAYAAQFVCDDYRTRTNCRCDTTAPRQMSECANPLDYQCTGLPCAGPSGTICIGNEYVGCRCDPSGLRPSDCATPEQFFCSFDHGFFMNCLCSPDAAPTACGQVGVCCQSDNPRFGCNCCPTPIK